MTLTHNPFAGNSALSELQRDLQMHIGDSERIASGILGVALLGASFSKTGIARWSLLVAASGCLIRGWTGKSLFFGRDRDRRHSASGVASNQGIKAEHSMEIHRSPEILYAWWRHLENLPKLSNLLTRVRQLGPRKSYWEASGPAGKTMDWYCEIINDEPNHLIAWQSLPDSAVRSAGSVHFEPNGAGGTKLRVVFQYELPAGFLGNAAAALLGYSPEAELRSALTAFKNLAEREFEPFPASPAT